MSDEKVVYNLKNVPLGGAKSTKGALLLSLFSPHRLAVPGNGIAPTCLTHWTVLTPVSAAVFLQRWS